MTERLLFGCGHLVGGASQTQADLLVARCLDAGVRWFDTAPVYGLGTAEAALASALRRDGRKALVSVKVGLPRPRQGILRSYLRAAKRLISGRRPQDDHFPSPPHQSDPCLPRGRFDLHVIARSFEETRRLLGSAVVINALFLHEAYADNLTADAVEALRDRKARGEARDLGLANGCAYSEALQALAPPDFLIQSAVPSSLFGHSGGHLTERHVFHTVIKSFRWRCSVDVPFRSAVASSRERFADLLGDEADVVLSYLLLAHAAPKSRFIYATTDVLHLDAFLRAMINVARENAAATIVDCFKSAYDAPLYGRTLTRKGS